MNRRHDRFESLAGAIALGEATEAEQATFAEHARTCSACRAGADAAALIALIGRIRDEEAWRPSVRDPVLARVRATGGSRTRAACDALSWAVVVSIAMNVAFTGGFASRLGAVLEPRTAPPAGSSAQRPTFERPAFAASAVARSRTIAAMPRKARFAVRVATPKPEAIALPAALAGLAIDDGRHLAALRVSACDPAGRSGVPEPCLSAMTSGFRP